MCETVKFIWKEVAVFIKVGGATVTALHIQTFSLEEKSSWWEEIFVTHTHFFFYFPNPKTTKKKTHPHMVLSLPQPQVANPWARTIHYSIFWTCLIPPGWEKAGCTLEKPPPHCNQRITYYSMERVILFVFIKVLYFVSYPKLCSFAAAEWIHICSSSALQTKEHIMLTVLSQLHCSSTIIWNVFSDYFQIFFFNSQYLVAIFLK